MPDYIQPPSTLGPGSIVWAYLRDSGGERQEQSVPQQKAEIEAYCKRSGLALAHVFADIAKSGGSVAGREAFEDLIDMSSREEWRPDGLLLWNFARFARDLDDSSYYKALLRKRGLVIHSLTDPIPEGTYSRVIETLIDIANEEKRRQTSRDVKRGLAALVRQGFAPGGYPPRGYLAEKVTIGSRRDGKPRVASRWIPDPDLWEDIKQAWALRAQGKSYGEIQKATGGRIYKTTSCWNSFFTNKTYLGIGKCGELEIQDHHQAAIDETTWERVQAIRQGSPRFGLSGHLHHPRRVAYPSLLSGLSRCILCGSAMVLQRANEGRGHPWPYYICGKKINQTWQSCQGRQVNGRIADRVILDTVFNRILTVQGCEELLSELNTQILDIDNLDREIELTKANLGEMDRKIRNLLDLVENYGARAGIDQLREREAERGQLIQDLRLLESKRKAAQVEITPEVLILLLNRWRGELQALRDGGDIRALRENLTRFVAKVELGYNIAKIWYTFPIEPLQEITPSGALGVWGHRMIGCKALSVEWE